jgi:glycosyltransferase involved in cell wall biosynthesis
MTVLYISYDGILEPLGQSQVLVYLRRLAADRSIHLISFEKEDDWGNMIEREHLSREIALSGIVWHPLRYHKRPTALSTVWDIFCGTGLGLWLVLRYRLRIVHARSYVPSVMALVLKRIFGIKYLFDMRGFWADEKLDSGWRQNGRLYRLAKGFERRFLLEADHVVSLTHAAVAEMQRFSYLQGHMPPVMVIPTCADLTRFNPMSHEREAPGLVIGYVGSVGRYMFDKVAVCFSLLLRLRPDTHFLIINRGEHAYIRECLATAGVPASAFKLLSASPADMPRQIALMDASIFFTNPVFSKKAMAPTKLAELLGCGVPCLSNAGVGDMSKVLEGEGVGVALRAFDQESLVAGLMRLLDLVEDSSTASRCVVAAHKYFSLDVGVRRYSSVYKYLLQ